MVDHITLGFINEIRSHALLKKNAHKHKQKHLKNHSLKNKQ